MKSTGLFTENLPIALAAECDLEKTIKDLLNMIDYSVKQDTTYKTHDSMWSKIIKGIDFVDWLYGNHDIEHKDIKRELQIRVSRAETLLGDIDFVSSSNQPCVFIVGIPSPDFVWTISEYLTFKQNRLKSIKSKSVFSEELGECFMNIFFDKSVPGSINTLQTHFDDIREEIVSHLQKLDEFYESFCLCISKNNSFEETSEAFKNFSGINCSPQAGRASVKDLKRKYMNTKTKVSEEITCELHTKFNTHNRDRSKQDRIYFHPGKPFICDGKIIVIHIGEHL